jgi:hypothetical protein
MLSRICVVALACIAVVAACGREPRGDEVTAEARALTVIGPDGNPRIYAGDQDSSGTRLCFQSEDTTLPYGAPATVVHSAFPQFATGGTLGRRSKRPCFPGPPGSPDSIVYVVNAPGDTIGWRGVPIIVLGRVPPIQMRGDTVMLGIEPGKPSWRFRTCASTEGIHATAWSGAPLTSPRRWHSYYYLGYDVEPDCTPADYKPDNRDAGR